MRGAKRLAITTLQLAKACATRIARLWNNAATHATARCHACQHPSFTAYWRNRHHRLDSRRRSAASTIACTGFSHWQANRIDTQSQFFWATTSAHRHDRHHAAPLRSSQDQGFKTMSLKNISSPQNTRKARNEMRGYFVLGGKFQNQTDPCLVSIHTSFVSFRAFRGPVRFSK